MAPSAGNPTAKLSTRRIHRRLSVRGDEAQSGRSGEREIAASRAGTGTASSTDANDGTADPPITAGTAGASEDRPRPIPRQRAQTRIRWPPTEVRIQAA